MPLNRRRNPRPTKTGPRPTVRRKTPLNVHLGDLFEEAGKAYLFNEGAQTGPQANPLDRFKTCVYREVRQLLVDGYASKIERAVNSCDSRPRKITFSQNPYYWALFAIYKTNEFDFLTPVNINTYGWQLLYAHNHFIDPELLTGFLYQTGATKSPKKATINKPGTDVHEWWLSFYRKRRMVSIPRRLLLGH